MSAAPAPQRREPADGRRSEKAALLERGVVPDSGSGFHSRKNKNWYEPIGRYAYRLVEVVVAVSGLVLTFPIAVFIAWLIKRDSPGPAVFCQARVAHNGQTFAFYKFRTLYRDARERWPELYAYKYTVQDIETKPFKTDDDPRVTKVGKWLRRTTLDEIPNLYNLLKGDVTFVGPRPEIPEMLPYYSQEELIKFSVKPGLTGLAQVTGRNHLTIKQTIEWDVYYVRHRSWRMDVSIVLQTIMKVIARDGAL